MDPRTPSQVYGIDGEIPRHKEPLETFTVITTDPE
jgi:hypothetical protein